MASVIRWSGVLGAFLLAACGQNASVRGPGSRGNTGNAQTYATTCTHDICTTGAALAASCDPCASQICGSDAFCCTNTWDATCVGEVSSICNQTCASCTGCVDGSGTCQAGTSASACGTGGAACAVCASGQSCNGGQCVAATCTGCVDGSGTCQAGTSASACGTGGAACVACASGQSCQNGSCVAATCTGCVDGSGTCQAGTSASACGTGGAACVACTSGQSCNSGQCVTGSSCLGNAPALEAACVPKGGAWGSGMSAQFGRIDGTLTAIATPGSSQCDQSNATHLVIEVTANGAEYPLVVNVDDTTSSSGVFFAETDAPLVGAPWQEGWHTDAAEKLDYVNNLGVHSTAFTAKVESDLVTAVGCELVPGDSVSIYALGWGTNGGHDIHRNTGGGGADGAVVLHANSASAHYLMFRFVNQSF